VFSDDARQPLSLGLVVVAPAGRFVIEQTPVPDHHGERRGVSWRERSDRNSSDASISSGYEIRRWRHGVIPDIAEAVSSPVRLTEEPTRASQIVYLVPSVPDLVWGRDEGHTGEIWNSNSVVSWLLARAGLDPDRIQPPTGGRSPGWRAGVEIAHRHSAGSPRTR